VARAQKKAERQQILRRLYEEKRNEQIMKNMVDLVSCVIEVFCNSLLKCLVHCSLMRLSHPCSGFKCLC